MTEALFVVVAIMVFAFVAMPIYNAKNRRGEFSKNNVNHRATELQERKDAIYEAIKDIEFDHQMGKLSDEDFQELRQQYKSEAVDLVKKLVQAQPKRGKAKSRQPKKKKQTSGALKFCWECGAEINPDDKFCGSCGTNLKHA